MFTLSTWCIWCPKKKEHASGRSKTKDVCFLGRSSQEGSLSLDDVLDISRNWPITVTLTHGFRLFYLRFNSGGRCMQNITVGFFHEIKKQSPRPACTVFWQRTVRATHRLAHFKGEHWKLCELRLIFSWQISLGKHLMHVRSSFFAFDDGNRGKLENVSVKGLYHSVLSLWCVVCNLASDLFKSKHSAKPPKKVIWDGNSTPVKLKKIKLF